MTQKPKIMIVGPNLEFGGVTRYLKDFVLRAQGHNVIVFNTARPKKRKIKAGTGYKEAFNSGIIRTFSGILVAIRNMIKFPFVLLKSQVKLVHICGVSFFPFWENSWYIIVAKLFRKPVTLHYLGAFDKYYENVGSFHKFLIRSSLKLPDMLFLLSDKVKIIIQDFVEPSKLLVLPSSVDTKWFSSQNRVVPEVSEEVRILFIGGLDPFRKGIYDLLQAFSKVITSFPKTTLVLTGGDSFIEVKSKWESMKLSDKIDFLGWIDDADLPNLYSSCDILVLPSYNEGLPYVIIEALSSGLPIVATNVGGIAEVVTNGENGFIIEPGDLQALTSTLSILVSDSPLRAKMSQNNSIKAAAKYSVDEVINSIEKIFQTLYSKSKVSNE